MHVLEVKNLSKSFGKTQIIKNISFTVGEGEIVGFIGPNGAGKTTTLKLITDLLRPDEGEITVSGYPLKRQREAALGSLAGIIENPGLYVNLTGLDNLMFIAKLRGISKEKLQRAIDLTGLGKNIHRQVRKYSLGMKQRLALGMCLITDPKLLILDEPTNGLDPTGTMELRELMLRMVSEEGVSILFSSHMLGEVEKIADRVLYIKDGVLLDKTVPVFDSYFNVTLNDPYAAASLLENVDGVISAKAEGKDKLSLHIREGALSEVLRVLTEKNIRIHDIAKQRDDLELIYSRIFRGVES